MLEKVPGQRLDEDPIGAFPNGDGSRVPYRVFSSQEVCDLEQERIYRGPT